MSSRKFIFFIFFTFVFYHDVGFVQDFYQIRYVPIGDSYTIGTGTTPERSWPAQLTQRLKSEGYDIQLITNPARAGWTTKNAIRFELPVFKESKPDFATLMIGVNDWVWGLSPDEFRSDFTFLLDAMIKQLKDKNKILVINIPDFSYTPNGKNFSNGRNISKGIAEFNAVIDEEASQRGVHVVDLYSTSNLFQKRSQYVSSDGLHPSAEGYAYWEGIIYPAVKSLLKK